MASLNYRSQATQPTFLERALILWWGATITHPLVVNLGAAALIVVVTDILLRRIIDPTMGLAMQIGIEFCVVAATLSTPFVITLLSLRKALHNLIAGVKKYTSTRAISVVLRLISEEVHEVVDKLENLRTGDGLKVPTGTVPEWVQKRCWNTMNGTYIGTARHLLSEYISILDDYLVCHADYLERTNALEGRLDSVRIMFCDEQKLQNDREQHQQDYDKFLNWHKNNRVRLGLLSWERAVELSDKYRIPHSPSGQVTTDMGCWDGELILLWKYGPDPTKDEVWLQMTLVEERLYENCRNFLDDITREAKPFPDYGSQDSP